MNLSRFALLFVVFIDVMGFGLIVPVTIAFAIMYPTMLSLFSASVGPTQQGWVMGLTVAIYALGTGTISALGGSLMAIDEKMPFFLAIGCCVIALVLIAALFRNPVMRQLDAAMRASA